MKVNKPLLIVGAISTIGIASVVAGGLANAATNTSGTSLVDKIASTFNLNKADVQKVFDQNRTDHEAAVQTKVENELTQAVTDGKLTSDQKDKILAKRAELKSQRESEHDNMKSKTAADRKALMDQHKADLEKWATDNNIPQEYLRYVMRGHGGHPGGPPPMDDNQQSNTSN